MRAKFTITLSSDDWKVERSANSEIQIDSLDGVAADIAKQDFLAQAEAIVRTISEGQIPALYHAVSEEHAELMVKEEQARLARSAEHPEVKTEHPEVKTKLAKLRQKKHAEEAGEPQDSGQDGGEQ